VDEKTMERKEHGRVGVWVPVSLFKSDKVVDEHCVEDDRNKSVEQVQLIDRVPIENGESGVIRARKGQHFL
jgi:hypothetical protein